MLTQIQGEPFVSDKQNTFLLVKPDGYQFKGPILEYLKDRGFQVSAHGDVLGGRDAILRHYNKDDRWCLTQGLRALGYPSDEDGPDNRRRALRYGRDVILEGQMVYYMSSGPMHYAVVSGEDVVARISALVGATEPCRAELGTIRNMWRTVPQLGQKGLLPSHDEPLELVHDSYTLARAQKRAVWNVVHASDSASEAVREAHIWLPTTIANGFFPLI